MRPAVIRVGDSLDHGSTLLIRMLLFASFALLITGSATAYVGFRLTAGLSGPWKWVVWSLVIANFVQMPVVFWLIRSSMQAPWTAFLRWSAYTGLGLFSVLFALLFVADIGRVLFALIDVGTAFAGSGRLSDHVLPDDPGRRRFLANMLSLGIAGLAGFVTLAGYREARKMAAVVRVDIALPGLHPALEGLRIVQISDVHVGPTIRGDYLRGVIEKVNELKPDLVAITGDLVDGRVAALRDHTVHLADIRAKHGAFFVTGNHEYYSGVHEWVAQIGRLGVIPLINEHRVVDVDGARLLVAGITDHRAGSMVPEHEPDPAASVAGAPDCDVRLLLAHQPRSAAYSVQHGFDLMLCGHTHGGQYMPWTFLIRFIEPFAIGLHRLEQMWIYTNRGTGYWGPPNRLGSPSEITLLTLRRDVS